MSPVHRRRLARLGALCLALAACAGPVRAVRVDPEAVLRDVGRSAITTGEPSLATRNVLFEYGLFEAFDRRPEAAMAELNRAMVLQQLRVGRRLGSRPAGRHVRPGVTWWRRSSRCRVTAVLRIAEARRALVQGIPLASRLELHLIWDEESVSIAGERIPLEAEPSAALARTFTGIPVQMYNRLHADPEIRGRYQFWFETLAAAVAGLDPQGRDPALRRADRAQPGGPAGQGAGHQ
jgi:hypothetical protein